jgi:hypothetical protein
VWAIVRRSARGHAFIHRIVLIIADRVEGRALQGVEMSRREGGPLMIATIDDIVDREKSERRIHELVTKAGY